MKPSLLLPDVLGAAEERGLPDPIAAPPVSDDLQTRFGPTGQAGRHTAVISGPYRDVFMDGYDRYATWDAAYVLGSLSAGDRREFETHMADCPACRQAVVEISGMPAMLSQFDGNDIGAINGSGHVSEGA
jgi:hypothetical protein